MRRPLRRVLRDGRYLLAIGLSMAAWFIAALIGGWQVLVAVVLAYVSGALAGIVAR